MSRRATVEDASWIARLYQRVWPRSTLLKWKLVFLIASTRPETRGVLVDLRRKAFCCYATVRGRVYISALGCRYGYASELATLLASVRDATGRRPLFTHLEPTAVPHDVSQALIWNNFRGTREARVSDLPGAATAEDVVGHFYYER